MIGNWVTVRRVNGGDVEGVLEAQDRSVVRIRKNPGYNEENVLIPLANVVEIVDKGYRYG